MNTEYLQIAHQIGARLCRDALWSLGRCNWIGHYLDGETLACGALGPEIYSGTSGIALFLWRLAEATGDRIIRVTAEGALRQALARMPMPGCGLYAGGLSVLFAAAEIRGECGEDEILRQAEPDSSGSMWSAAARAPLPLCCICVATAGRVGSIALWLTAICCSLRQTARRMVGAGRRRMGRGTSLGFRMARLESAGRCWNCGLPAERIGFAWRQ